MGSETVTYGPDNTGITCGSGATAFNIFTRTDPAPAEVDRHPSDPELTVREAIRPGREER